MYTFVSVSTSRTTCTLLFLFLPVLQHVHFCFCSSSRTTCTLLFLFLPVVQHCTLLFLFLPVVQHVHFCFCFYLSYNMYTFVSVLVVVQHVHFCFCFYQSYNMYTFVSVLAVTLYRFVCVLQKCYTFFFYSDINTTPVALFLVYQQCYSPALLARLFCFVSVSDHFSPVRKLTVIHS